MLVKWEIKRIIKVKQIINSLKEWQTILFNGKLLFDHKWLQDYKKAINARWINSIKILDWLEVISSIYF